MMARKTRMHSGRMRTVRSSGRLSGDGGGLLWGGGLLPGGGVCTGGGVPAPGGVCSGGVSAPGGGLLQGGCLLRDGVCSRGGGGGIPACTEADTPPRRGQTHACKNITFATSLRTVIMSLLNKLADWPLKYHKTARTFPQIFCTPSLNE